MQNENDNTNNNTSYSEAIPLYHQIVTSLKQKIINGELKIGDKIPTEKWLSKTYQVSRVTVRKALDDLMEQGYVERRPNKGSFVIQPKYNSNFSRMRSMHQELVASGVVPSSKILSYQIMEADEFLCEHLLCRQKEPILVITRLRYADDRPFAEQTLYLPQQYFDDFNPWLLTDHSLHDIMEEKYHIEINHSTQTITAKMPTKEQQEVLGATKDKPILHIKSTVYTKDNKVCEYADTYFMTEVVRYSFTWYR